MSSMTVTVSGYLGNTPFLRKTSAGTHWVRFSLACNASYRDVNGNWTSGETTWFNCKAWGTFAVNIAESLHKGDPVVAQGRLVPGTYEHADKTTGVVEKRPELALHLTHIGVDLVHTPSINIKYAKETSAEENSAKSSKFDIPADSLNTVRDTGFAQTESDLVESADILDELDVEMEAADEESLISVGADAVPF
ncbi:single-strand binding family protein [Mobiluncus curtisii subsp. curtisii ATCC 35241]|uniref:Single-stranded DNA-binding protein n=2 Tax=Mobiluncus curtisii TaxID=2051 RepID=A0A7Y0UGK5_9ACTO|nr:single-stranded DNA-binding protein [Mobiluncus curtisii]EFL93004.1 single-strand binding family protein [Mobiluncus curtisii subsp. curtisii ATCC 35241]STY76725.1 Helix-destabilizing protein 2 [Mobiluncus curtisii subsp. curtisii]MCU9986986.1 single-stranded DNA-binding protein [Mobiluncus curtisii]MCU9999886.1 single-stranded DNA-binding protein [Mobiluncus curtisii]NMW44300.1 single-stranded DNA-binding protein [Mobiluncus curtisii]